MAFFKRLSILDPKESFTLRKEMSTENELAFKICPVCGQDWRCRDTFLDDQELNFNGFQPDFSSIEEGIFYFTHETPQCGSTMALKVEIFLPLFKGRRYQENKQRSEECSVKCLNRQDLDRCPAHCLFAFVREVSQIIKDRSHRLR